MAYAQAKEKYDMAVKEVDRVFAGREAEIAAEIDARWFPVLKIEEWYSKTIDIMFQNSIDNALEATGTFGSMIADSMKYSMESIE